MQGLNAGRHEFQMRAWQRGLYSLLGLLICCAAIVFAWTLGSGGRNGTTLLLAVVPMALGLWLVAAAVRSRLVIDGTRIEVRGAFREQSAELNAVEGFRTISTRNGSYWRLQLKEGRGSITIRKSFDCDDLRAWFQQLTDLDERDRKAVLDAIEQSQELGATPEDRLARLSRARRWNVGLSGVAILAAFGFALDGSALHVPAAI